jgi:hydrogenase-4 component F
MPLVVLVAVPLAVALPLALGLWRRAGPTLLVLVSVVASVAAAVLALSPVGFEEPVPAWLQVGEASRLFLLAINPIFGSVAVYVWHRVRTTPALEVGIERTSALMLVFLAASNAVLVLHQLVAMWLALELTALVAAPLIARPGVRSSERAAWRYLLFSSVGLGLTLLGFLCLERGLVLSGLEPTLLVGTPLGHGTGAGAAWTQLGLLLAVVGLGCKLGLAPMYTWLPEAYDEAPPAVTALLGAVQFTVALVMLFRVVELLRPLHPALVSGALLTLGLVSMAVSTVSIIATRNLKRLIAYASINHAGVIAIGLALGAAASYGLLLYVLSNAFIKAILFLTAGKISAHTGTKDTRAITGLIKHLPYSGVFLMIGTFALLGFPPFGSFLGELLILSALMGSGHLLVFGAFGVLVTMTFIATGRTVFPMIWGEPPEGQRPRQSLLVSGPKLVFLAALVVLGVYIPSPVNSLIERVSVSMAAR